MSKCILVVEDQEDNRRILRDLLGNAGFELIEAESGEDALSAVTTRRPDLILMDIQLSPFSQVFDETAIVSLTH
jgi:two-component system cell cycle response regulator DivK